MSLPVLCKSIMHVIDGLVHERRNSSVLVMESRLSCTNPSLGEWFFFQYSLYHRVAILLRILSISYTPDLYKTIACTCKPLFKSNVFAMPKGGSRFNILIRTFTSFILRWFVSLRKILLVYDIVSRLDEHSNLVKIWKKHHPKGCNTDKDIMILWWCSRK